MTEEDGIAIFQKFSLNIFVFLVAAVSRQSHLGNLLRQVQLGVQIHQFIQGFRIVDRFGPFRFIFQREEAVELHADGVQVLDTVPEQPLNLHVIGVAVVIGFRPPDVIVIDDQLVVGEVPVCHPEAPVHKIVFIEEFGFFSVLQCFVGDLKAGNIFGVPLRDFPETLFQKRLMFGDGSVLDPVGGEIVVVQAVALGFNTFFLTVVDAQIRGRTAIDFGRVSGIPGLALFRFQIGPVEGDCSQIKTFRELFFIDSVLCFGFQLIQHKNVAAELEFVVFLPNLQGDVLGQFSVGSDKGDSGVTFTVQFNAALHPEVHDLFLFVKVFQGSFCSSHD